MRNFDHGAIFDDALHQLDEVLAHFVVLGQAIEKKLVERHVSALE